MTLGNVMALRQDDVVRLLAWSTVAQAGWVVLPLVGISALGVRRRAAYLLTYVVATLVAFAVVAASPGATGPGGPHPRGLRGAVAAQHPWRAGALGLALTSLAGLPPGLLGLVAKVVALRPVVAEGWGWLAVVAAANAVIGVAVYLRWLRVLLGTVPGEQPVARAGRLPGGGAGRRGCRTGRRGRRCARGRTPGPPAVLAAVALTFAALVLTSIAPDLVLRLLG